jgi:hypothetical protein
LARNVAKYITDTEKIIEKGLFLPKCFSIFLFILRVSIEKIKSLNIDWVINEFYELFLFIHRFFDEEIPHLQTGLKQVHIAFWKSNAVFFLEEFSGLFLGNRLCLETQGQIDKINIVMKRMEFDVGQQFMFLFLFVNTGRKLRFEQINALEAATGMRSLPHSVFANYLVYTTCFLGLKKEPPDELSLIGSHTSLSKETGEASMLKEFSRVFHFRDSGQYFLAQINYERILFKRKLTVLRKTEENSQKKAKNEEKEIRREVRKELLARIRQSPFEKVDFFFLN